MNTWDILKNISAKDLWSGVKDSVKQKSVTDFIHLNPTTINDFDKIYQNYPIPDRKSKREPEDFVDKTRFILELVYLCAKSEEPEKTLLTLIPIEGINGETRYLQLLFYNSSSLLLDSLKQELIDSKKQKQIIDTSFDTYKSNISKQIKNLELIVDLTKKEIGLISSNPDKKSIKDKNDENPQTYQNEIQKKIDHFVSDNGNVSKEDINLFLKEIIDIYENHHFKAWGFIHDDMICWTSEIRQFVFVIEDLDAQHFLNGKNNAEKIDYLKNKVKFSFSEQNWNSHTTNWRNLQNSSYKNPQINLALDFSPNINFKEASDYIKSHLLNL